MFKHLLSPLLFLGLCLPGTAQDYSFRLKNTLAIDRQDETVEVVLPEDINPTTHTLKTENGTIVPFEALADGHTIRFRATVPHGATTGYTLTDGTPTAPSKVTYAAVKMPSTRDDIAWENDLCAYRMYSSTLLKNEPNTAQGVDVWFKKKAIPVIDDMYKLSNYHNESQYGVDAYSVNGKRLGCGGTAAVVGGHLQMHNPYNSCVIDEQSALQSSFTLTYNNVMVDGSAYTKTLHVTTTAGALLNKATVRFEGPAKTFKLAVAVYQHTDMTHLVKGVADTKTPGLVAWAEAKSEGSITSAGARFFQGAYIPSGEHAGAITTEVIDSHLCLTTDYTVGTELTFYFGGGWSIFPAGRYDSDEAWFEALLNFKQTIEQPLAPTSMQTLPQREEVLHILNTVNQTWQERHPNHGDYFWNRAVYHIGNMAAYDVTGDEQYRNYSTAWAERSNWWGATGTDPAAWQYKTYGEGSNWVLFGDNQVCFQVYADLYNLDPQHEQKKIERALEVMGYEISTEDNDYLWWVDGLFMVMPIMTKLYHITGEQAYLDKMYDYWQYANSIMYDEETGLYFRDAKYVYPAHTTYSGKKDFWARGDGWIFAAFAKVLSELPEDDVHREEYITYYRRMAAALKACQQDEGYWTRSLLDPAQAPGRETSGTALNTFAYAWGIRNGILSEVEYGATLERAWNYLSTIALQENGTVGYIQPIGENASPNTTIKATDYHDFGIGAYLMAVAEMSKLAADDANLPKLRMTGVRLSDDAARITVTFNQQPDATEASDAGNYLLRSLINGDPYLSELTAVDAADFHIGEDHTVTITLSEPLDYGRYELIVSDIHSEAGGEMADNQRRTLMRTVPLDGKQDDITITAIGRENNTNVEGNVNDSNLSTRWSQEGMNQWICFELKDVKNVYAVDMAFYNGNQRTFTFKIQTSIDNRTWTDATGTIVSSGLTNQMERYRFTPVEARYVRILCSGNSTNKWNSPTEIRIRFNESVGIDEITEKPQSTTPVTIYDLSGRRIHPATWNKGIFIVNGRKVVKK